MAKKEKEVFYGRYKGGKLVRTTRRYNFLKGGNWKTGFSGVGVTGGEEIEYEIVNKELIEESLIDKTYKFNVIRGKAKIIE